MVLLKKLLNTVALAAVFLTANPTAWSADSAAVKVFKVYTVELSGVKFWLPSVIVVHKGDKVRLEAVSKIPGPTGVHGLDIPEFKIKEVIDDKGKTFEFTAARTGVFPFSCHLHPPHVGGQLVVLD